MGEPGSHSYARSCPDKIYYDTWKSHWSLQCYVVHNSRFRQGWPFPHSLSQEHIEHLFEVGFLVNGIRDRTLPTIHGYMSPADFQVCKTPDPDSAQKFLGSSESATLWQADEAWGEAHSVASELVGALFRMGMLLSYATGMSYRNDDRQLANFVAVVAGLCLICLALLCLVLLRCCCGKSTERGNAQRRVSWVGTLSGEFPVHYTVPG